MLAAQLWQQLNGHPAGGHTLLANNYSSVLVPNVATPRTEHKGHGECWLGVQWDATIIVSIHAVDIDASEEACIFYTTWEPLETTRHAWETGKSHTVFVPMQP